MIVRIFTGRDIHISAFTKFAAEEHAVHIYIYNTLSPDLRKSAHRNLKYSIVFVKTPCFSSALLPEKLQPIRFLIVPLMPLSNVV